MFAGLPEGPHLQETVHAYTGCHLAQQQSVRRLGTCSGFRVSPSETRTQKSDYRGCLASGDSYKLSCFCTNGQTWSLCLCDMAGRVVVVVGACGNIGFAVVKLLLESCKFVRVVCDTSNHCTSQPDSTSFRDSYGQINAQNFCAGILKCF